MSALRALRRFVRDESGLELLEYAIIGGIITAASIVTIAAIGLWLSQKFERLNNALSPDE